MPGSYEPVVHLLGLVDKTVHEAHLETSRFEGLETISDFCYRKSVV